MLRNHIVRNEPFRRHCCTSFTKVREKFANLGEGSIDLDLDNITGIANITIDQQNRKNAISGKMMVDLENAVNKLETWSDGKAILLQGRGNFFCSGGDLVTVKYVIDEDYGTLMSAYMQQITSRLENLPLVSFALVHGGALGGGAELALCTDFRIFSDHGAMGFVQAKMAISTGWGGGTRLTRLVGPQRALQLLLSCRKINHQEALKIGLADFVVSSENRTKSVNELINNLVQCDKVAIHAVKRVVSGAKSLSCEESLCHERTVFSTVWGSPSHKKMLASGLKHK